MFHKFAKLLIESKAMFYFNILKTQYCNFSFGILVNFLKDPSLKKKKKLNAETKSYLPERNLFLTE